MEKRKTLSLKGPRVKREKPDDGLVYHKPRKKRKKKAKPKPVKIPKPQHYTPRKPLETTPAWDHLSTSPTWRDGLQMAIGFFEQALESAPESVSKRQLERCMKSRARGRDYLLDTQATADRYNFDGSPAPARVLEGEDLANATERIERLLRRADQKAISSSKKSESGNCSSAC